MSTEQVTLMMVTYNRADFTRSTITHLQNVTKRDFNLAIVDNGSVDDTHTFLTKLEMDVMRGRTGPIKNISIYKNKENRGIGIGRTQALLLANKSFPETKWYATVDNDIEVPDGWLNEAISILHDIPKYGMIGVNFTGKKYPMVKFKGYQLQHVAKETLGAACIVFPKSVHKKIGYFNHEYGLYGHEDADFCLRAKLAGFQIGYLSRDGNCLDERSTEGEEVYVSFRREHRKKKDHLFEANKQKFFKNLRDYTSGNKALFIGSSVEL